MEKQDQDLEAYQLSSSVLKKLDVRNGVLNSFHQSFEESPRYQEYLEMLEYDMLYGEQAVYGGTSRYSPTDMQMGVVPVVMDQYFLLGDTLYVLGDQFTPYSRICINGIQWILNLSPPAPSRVPICPWKMATRFQWPRLVKMAYR